MALLHTFGIAPASKEPKKSAEVGLWSRFEDTHEGDEDELTEYIDAGQSGGRSTSAKKNGSYGYRVTTAGSIGELGVCLSGTETLETIDVSLFIKVSDAANAYCDFTISNADSSLVGGLSLGTGKFLYCIESDYAEFTTTPSDNIWYRLRIVESVATQKASYYLYDNTGVGLVESHLNQDAFGPFTEIAHWYLICYDYALTSVTADFDDFLRV